MRLLRATLAIFVLAGPALGQAGPDIRVIDDKVSIQAASVPLARLLRLLDFATGMTSKVPPELANRAVSVQFSDLDLNAAVQKIFEGQMLDFVYIDGQGILVTASSQRIPNTPGAASPTPFPRDPSPFEPAPGFSPEPQQFIPDPVINPGLGGIPGQQNPFGNGNQQQPAVIQTPFGPIPNPRANQAAQPNAPLSGPGGAANPAANPFGGTNPFGGATPFGTVPVNPFANMPNTGAPPTASSPGASPITPLTTQPLVPTQQPKP